MTVVAHDADGRDAIQQFRAHRPDVTLMDIQMPEMSGRAALVAIRAEFLDAKVIVLTTYKGDVHILRALKAGAQGYLLKNTLHLKLLQRSALAGATLVAVAIPDWALVRPSLASAAELSENGHALVSNRSSGLSTQLALRTPKSKGAAILEKPVSDRATLEDLSQSPRTPFKHGCKLLILNGEMAEWSMAHAWKAMRWSGPEPYRSTFSAAASTT